jgi:hypothetical protein
MDVFISLHFFDNCRGFCKPRIFVSVVHCLCCSESMVVILSNVFWDDVDLHEYLDASNVNCVFYLSTCGL